MTEATDNLQDPNVDELLAQRDQLFDLSLEDLHRRYIDQPVLSLHTFGEGNQAQETLRGNRTQPFNGVCVLNPSPKVIYVGFDAGTSQGSPLFCPAGAALVWPARYSELSISVSSNDAAGPVATISVLRLQWPPTPAVYSPYGPESVSVTNAQPVDLAIAEADTAVLAANPQRRGVDIYNTGTTTIRLALGLAAAEAKRGIVLAKGERWTGRVSGALWRGTIRAFSEGGAGTLAVLEV